MAELQRFQRPLHMTKDDKYGLAGVLFCSVIAWYDEQWRPFWAAGAILLGVWTAVSLLNRRRS